MPVTDRDDFQLVDNCLTMKDLVSTIVMMAIYCSVKESRRIQLIGPMDVEILAPGQTCAKLHYAGTP